MTLKAVLFSVTSGAVWLLTARIICVLKVPSGRMIIDRRYVALIMASYTFIALMAAITHILVTRALFTDLLESLPNSA